jgi:hypothetical protein
MTPEDAAELREKQMLELKAAIADAITGVAALDSALVMMLGEIVHKPPFAQQELELASLIVFSQSTIERRIDMVRKVITLRLAGLLQRKPNEYPHKVAAFILKAFNIAAAAATKDIWIRNTAAHSNFYVPQNAEPKIIPMPFDFEAVQRHNERKGVKGGAGFLAFGPDSGFTAAELKAFAASLAVPMRQLNKVREALIPIMQAAPQEVLEAALVALGKDLQLQAPLLVPPHRGRRAPKRTK